jgi:hypothetical protein
MADKDKIIITGRILMRGQRNIIPTGMQGEMLERIHETHLGITKSKHMAAEFLLGPQMSQTN